MLGMMPVQALAGELPTEETMPAAVTEPSAATAETEAAPAPETTQPSQTTVETEATETSEPTAPVTGPSETTEAAETPETEVLPTETEAAEETVSTAETEPTEASLLSAVPAANTALASGTCGESLSWTLEDTGVLTISGTGDMEAYTTAASVPWYEYRTQITSIVMEKGVTGVGMDAFYYCTALTEITLPASVSSIGNFAFRYCSALTTAVIPAATIGREAFRFCSKLTSVTFSEGLTTISDYAFAGCTKLASVAFPDGLTTISEYAFSGCSSLASADLPGTVTTIGAYAFQSTSLTGAVIPEGVTAIENGVFAYCEDLAQVTIPSTVTTIGNYAFTCAPLTSVTLPEGLTSLGASAFNSCEKLTNINLPKGLTAIGDYTFNYCTSLTGITIPEGVTSIGNYAFRNCQKMTYAVLPSTVTTIGTSAFQYCYGLTSIALPEGLTAIGSEAFYNCSKLASLTLPSTLTSIGKGAFAWCYELTAAAIPEGITAIADNTFQHCSKLTSVTIPSTVAAIGANAFMGTNLTGVTIPAAVTSIGSGAFSSCVNLAAIRVEEANTAYASQNGILFSADMTTLMQYPAAKEDTSYAIPDTVTTISGSAFYRCENLTSVTIPSGVTTIGAEAFYSSSALTSVEIPGSVSVIGESAFEYCTALTGVTLNEGITQISDSAFLYCDLTAVAFPESLTSIGRWAFGYCDALTSVSIGSGITSIGDSAFYDCTGITSFDVAEGNTVYTSDDGVLMNKDKTEIIQFPFGKTSYTIPETVTVLGNYIFNGCTSLTSIVIPGTLTSFGTFAFSGCSALASVTLSEGITTIDYGTFARCTALASITIPASVTTIDSSAFTGCSGLKEIHFLGDAPTIKSDSFGNSYDTSSKVSATAYYPPDNDSWTADVMQSYGGNLVWAEEGAVELVDMGSCGSSLTWTLDVNNLLTISGTGEMTAYRSASAVPWYSYISTITDVVIEEGVTTLSAYAFRDAAGLTNATLPASLTGIGSYAFQRCTGLTSVVIPGGVTEISESAFSSCTGLTSVTLNEGLLTIGYGAFQQCTGLTSIVIPNSVTTIGDQAFAYCTALTDVTMGENVTNISTYSFWQTPWYNSLEKENGFSIINNVLVDYEGTETSVTVPEGVTAIGASAFASCRDIVSVTLPDTVTDIQERAFSYCTALQEISVPASITTIGANAFSQCSALESIFLPGVVSIGDSAFYQCTGLTTVTLSDSLRSLGYGVFNRCSGLSSITLPEGLQTIGSSAFYQCTSLTDIVIPDSVTSMGNNAFYGCSALTNVQIGGALRELAYSVFAYCTSLKAITIPVNISYIRNSAFQGCAKLADVTFDEAVSLLGGVEDDDWAGEEDTTYPDVGTVLEIHSYAFGDCMSLIELYMPSHLTYLASDAFRGSLNTEGYWVSSVTYSSDDYGCVYQSGTILVCVPAKLSGDYVIKPEATKVYADFYGCSLLTSLTFPTAVGGTRGENVFYGCTSLVKVIAGPDNTIGYSNDDSDALIWTSGSSSYVCFIPADITEYTVAADVVKIYNAAFANAKLTAIHVEDGNTTYSSRDGVLYDADGTTLTLYPRAKADTSYVIPMVVDSIANYAFAGAENLQELWFTGEAFFPSSNIFGNDVTESGSQDDPFMTCYYPENIGKWADYILEMGYYFGDGIQWIPYTLYTIGTDATVTMEADKITAVRTQKDISGLTAVYVDGKKIAASNYTVSVNGNFVVFSQAYQTTLAAGDHTVKFVFADGNEEIGTEDTVITQTEFTEEVRNAGGDYTLTKNMTLERDMEIEYLQIGDCGSITVPEGVTLTVVYEMTVTGGTITVENGGTLIIKGSLAEFSDGSALNVASGGSVVVNARTMVIRDTAVVSNQGTIQVKADSRLVNYGTIENGGEIAVGGTFNNYSTFTGHDTVVLEEPDYQVVISGPKQVLSGKSITLEAQLLPSNLTNTSIVWSLADPADKQYVTLSNGKITARKVTDQSHVVTVIAASADGEALPASTDITVIPLTSSVQVSWETGVVADSGTTLYYDLNNPESGSILLRAATLPADAGDGIDWTVSDKKGTYVTFTENEDGTLALTPTGEVGSVTVTAKASDGSGKTAKVTVKLMKLAQEIQITNVQSHLRGGAKLSLSTDIASDKTLTSRNVVWSLVDDEEATSSAYATITSKGKLTSRVVSVPTLIKVKVSLKENPAVFESTNIMLHPAVDAVQILRDGNVLTNNTTIYADPEHGSLTFSAAFNPNGCIEEGGWTVSAKKGIVTYAENEDGTLTITPVPGGKNGTVTITFKASDGSKKSAKVKVKFSNLAENITLTPAQAQLCSGGSQVLTATVTDDDGNAPTSKALTWTSSDPAVAKVSSSGKVTAKTVYENTTVTITATAKDGSGTTASAVIAVCPKLTDTLVLQIGDQNVTGKTHAVNIDGTNPISIQAKFYNSANDSYTAPEDSAAAELVLTSSSKTVANFDENGELQLLKTGKATITAKLNGQTAKFTLQVVRHADKVAVTGKSDWLLSGKTLTLKAAVSAETGKPTSKAVTWASSDESAATVSASGKVTAKKVYQRKTVTITATAKDGSGEYGQYSLTIYPAATTVSILAESRGVLNNRTIEVSLTDTLQLTAMVYPWKAEDGGAMQDVTWTSSSKKVAAIAEDGTLTLRKKGTTTIKATAKDGSKKSVSFKLKVVEP